jgi:NitT/TauT family transport system ATP-binding protein
VIFVTHMIEEAVLLSDRVIVMSHRPGTIRAECSIALPRPRDMDTKSDPHFRELENQIWKLIEEEVRTAGGFGRF